MIAGRKFINIIIIICLFAGLNFSQALAKENNTLFQVSTISALMEGNYQGQMSFRDLKKHGDFAIGTFNDLDGELIGLDGKFYQVKCDGKAYPVNDSMKTSFAAIVPFKSNKSLSLNNINNPKQLEEYLNSILPTENIPYAIKITGNFTYLKARSVPPQTKPYPPLAKAAEHSPIFEFRDVNGTMLGYKIPEYLGRVNVPGYHFHFLTDDKKAGGHVLGYQIKNAKVEINYINKIFLDLPENSQFYSSDLSKEKRAELEKIEK